MSLSSSLSTSGMPRGDAEDKGAALTWVRQSLAQRRSVRAASANAATSRASQSGPLSLTTHRSVDFDLSGVCAASMPSSSAMAAPPAAPASICGASEPLSAAHRMRYSCAGLDAGRGARASSALEGGLPLSGSPAPSLAPSTSPVAVSWVLQPPPPFHLPPAPALPPSLAAAAPVTSPPPARRITVYAGFLPHTLDAHDLAAAVFPRSSSTTTLISGAAGNSRSNSPMSHASQVPPSPHAVSSELSHDARGGLRAAPSQPRPPRVHSNSNARRGTELLLQYPHDTSASSAVNSNTTTTTATAAGTTMMTMGSSSSGGSPKHSRDAYDENLAEAMVSTMARMVESERRRESSSAAAAVGGAGGGVGGTFLYQPSPPQQPPLSPQQQHQRRRPSRRHEPTLYPSGPSSPALTLGSAQSGAGGGVDAAAWDSTSTQSPRGGSPLTPFTRHAAEAAVAAAAAAARRGDVAGVLRVDNALVDADGGVNASSTRGTRGAVSRPSVVSAAVSVHRLRRRHRRRGSNGAAAAGSRNANPVWASEASSSDADAEEHDADAPAARAPPRSRLSATTTAICPVPVAAAAAAPIAGTHEGTTSRKRTSLAATTGTSPRASLTASTLDDAPQLSHHQLTDAFYCSYKGADMARDAYRYFISQQQPPSMQEQQQQQPQRRGTATQRPPKHPRPSRSAGRSTSTSGSIAQAPRSAAAAAAAVVAAASSTTALDPALASRRVPTISTTCASLPSGSGAGRRSVTVAAAGARAGRANNIIAPAAASITHAVPPQSDPAAVAFEAPLWLRSGAPLHAHHQHRPSSSSSPASASVPIYAAGGAGSTWRTPLRSASSSTSSSMSASLRHSHELHLTQQQQQQRTSSSSSNWSPPQPPDVQPHQRPRRPSAPHTPGSKDAPSPLPGLRRPSQANLDELSNAALYRCAAALDASGTSSDGDVGHARRAPLQVPHLEADLHETQRATGAGAARRSSAHGVAEADTRSGDRRPSARSPGGDGRKSPAVPPLSALAVSLTTAAAGHPTGETVACPRVAAAAAAACAADLSAPAHLAPLVPAAAGNENRARPATALAAAAAASATTTERPAAMKPVKLSRRVSTAVPDATRTVGGVAPFAAQLSAPQVQGGRSGEVSGGGGYAGARRGAAPYGDLAPPSHATARGAAAADRIQALLWRSVCIFEEAQQQAQQQSLHP